MATDYTARASMDNDWNRHGVDKGKDRVTRKRNTLEESQRKTAGKQATQHHAQINPNIVVADTHKNIDFVNDGNGGFRDATSVEDTIAYGEERLGRVTHKLGDTNKTWITSVFHLPYSMCEEVPDYYPVLNKKGDPTYKDDGTPKMRSRWVIKPGMEDEAKRYFDEALQFYGDNVTLGGQESIHGGSINLDESRPHMQIISDALVPNTRSKEPRALKNGFSFAMGDHRKSRRIPHMDYKTGKQLLDKNGEPKTRLEGSKDKAERHHREFKAHMIERGFEIEAERDPQRHNRRQNTDEYALTQDLAREATETFAVAADAAEQTEERLQKIDALRAKNLVVFNKHKTEVVDQRAEVAKEREELDSERNQFVDAANAKADELYEREQTIIEDSRNKWERDEKPKVERRAYEMSRLEWEQNKGPAYRKKVAEEERTKISEELGPLRDAAATDRAKAQEDREQAAQVRKTLKAQKDALSAKEKKIDKVWEDADTRAQAYVDRVEEIMERPLSVRREAREKAEQQLDEMAGVSPYWLDEKNKAKTITNKKTGDTITQYELFRRQQVNEIIDQLAPTEEFLERTMATSRDQLDQERAKILARLRQGQEQQGHSQGRDITE